MVLAFVGFVYAGLRQIKRRMKRYPGCALTHSVGDRMLPNSPPPAASIEGAPNLHPDPMAALTGQVEAFSVGSRRDLSSRSRNRSYMGEGEEEFVPVNCHLEHESFPITTSVSKACMTLFGQRCDLLYSTRLCRTKDDMAIFADDLLYANGYAVVHLFVNNELKRAIMLQAGFEWEGNFADLLCRAFGGTFVLKAGVAPEPLTLEQFVRSPRQVIREMRG